MKRKRMFRVLLLTGLAFMTTGALWFFSESRSQVKAVNNNYFPLSTTENDFFVPGTQPNRLVDNIADPATCDLCHTAPIYGRWRGSMMAQAGRDPLLWAALTIANNDAPGAGDYCLRCHAPKGWLEGRSHPADGSALMALDLDAGVACEVCHRLVDPIPSTSDEAVSLDAGIRAALTSTIPAGHVSSAMMIVDPEDNRRGPFAFETDLPHPRLTLQTDFLGQSNDHITRARLCGTCHTLDNPALSWDSGRNQYWPGEVDTAAPSFEKGALFPLERTFDEWLNSDYTTGVYAPQFAGARPDGIVGACQDCHMPRATGRAAKEAYEPVFRDCQTTGCLPEHDLVGGNTWVPQLLQDSRWRLSAPQEQAGLLNNTMVQAREMLQKAATLTATLSVEGGSKIAKVRVTNETGHKLPTGYPEGRRIWINLKAYAANNSLIYESGAYNWNTAVLTKDAAVKIYETKHGLTQELATLLNLPAGESFHFVLNNQIIKDNRIPPRGFTPAALNEPGLQPVGATYAPGQFWDETVYIVPLETERLVVTLYYQTSSKEYIDFLRNNGELDGETLGEMWDTLKSPPEVMAVAYFPPSLTYFPIVFK